MEKQKMTGTAAQPKTATEELIEYVLNLTPAKACKVISVLNDLIDKSKTMKEDEWIALCEKLSKKGQAIT